MEKIRSLYNGIRADICAKESGDWLVYPWDPESKYARVNAARVR